jgi:predicted dehydrogenase
VLVEAPMAMCLADAQRLVETARQREVVLAVSHPLRLRPPLAALAARIAMGEESLLSANAVFYMASPRAPVGRRSPTWTDNVLWHHMSHGADLIHWLAGGAGRAVAGGMAAADPHTGIPMRAWAAIDLSSGFGLVSADYFGSDRNEILLVTDRDTYRFDQRRATFSDRTGSASLPPPLEHLGLVAGDFVAAVSSGGSPAISGESVLPQMRSLQYVQDAWDRHHGPRSLPGRTAEK